METIQDFKDKVFSHIEEDGLLRAQDRLKVLCQKRGGKFKISEKQFVQELSNMWVGGEFSAAERLLRVIEADPELDTKDMIRGEIQMYVIRVFNILKKRLDLDMNVRLEDLLYGKYATEEVLKARNLALQQQAEETPTGLQ